MKKNLKSQTDIANLGNMTNFINYDETLEVKEETFKKLMFIYSIALKELEMKMQIFKEEYDFLYDYELIDHINKRIKSPESIIEKMKKKECNITYKEMIYNINDIAGMRIICPLKKDIYSVKNLILKLPGVKILKEKDYIQNQKKTGYSSYHLVVEVPVMLAENFIYVKVEIQIRSMAMDFWASIEHKLKYKSKDMVSNKVSKELIACAKTITKLDSKMMLLSMD